MKQLMILPLLLCTAFSAIAQTPIEIINQHIEAIGGRKKILDMKSIKTAYKYDNEFLGSGSLQLVLDVGAKIEARTMLGNMTTIVNKKKGWSIYSLTEEDKPTVEELSSTDRSLQFPSVYIDMEEQLYNEELVSYARYNGESKYTKAELQGRETVNNRECYKIKVNDDGDITTWFIDVQTYYCLKKIEKNDKKELVSTEYSDFRKNADGCTFPFVEKTYSEGKLLLTNTYSEIETNYKVDKSQFTYKE